MSFTRMMQIKADRNGKNYVKEVNSLLNNNHHG